LAKELDVPVIALSQLSRAVEQRGGDKRPQLSDLRESGSIEQDADVVMFLYRPEYYGITTTNEGQSTAGMAEVIIGKQRNGPVGSKMLYFVKDYARFENLTVNDAKGDFVGVPLEDNLLSSSGDFSAHNPGEDAMIPNSPMPSDDEAPF
jgi:replicative DNA helicase